MRSVTTVIRIYLIVSALLPEVLLWRPSPGQKAPICVNSECGTRGSLYHANMVSSGHPCEDFYEFACGRWAQQNPRPKDLLSYNVLSKMQLDTLEQLLAMVKQPATHTDSVELRRIKKVFGVCMNIPFLGKGDATFIVDHIENVGRYPTTTVWDMLARYVKLTGESPLFDIQVVADVYQNDDPLLLLKSMKSPFGSFVQMRGWNADQEKFYLSFLVNLVMYVWKDTLPALDQAALIPIIRNVINFRTKLGHISRTSKTAIRNPLGPRNPLEIQNWYDRHTKNTRRTEINWITLIRNLYSGQPDAPFLKNPSVRIFQEKYFIELIGLLSKTSEETLAYHYEIYFMERHLIFPTAPLQNLEKFLTKLNSYSGFTRTDEVDRSFECIRDISMDEDQGKLYVANYFQKKNIPMVEDILEEMRDAIKIDIMNSKWPDYETKVASIRRINDIKWWIGYPPWYDDPSETRTTTLTKPANTNAHLAISANRISVSAALIRSPIFDLRVPDVINYGAMGAIVGHEMYHALDDCSQFRNLRGELQTWWSNPMRAKCLVQKKCFIDQYSTLAKEQLIKLRLPFVLPTLLRVFANATSSFVEDLPDVMGLEAAYHAYQARLKKKSTACSVLPHFEEYSCDQMFFLSFANMLCGSQVPESAYVTMRKYSPLRIRVNGAVSNSIDFSRAFGCPAGSPMNPQKRCNLWVL